MRNKAARGERSTVGSWYEEGNEKEKDVWLGKEKSGKVRIEGD